MPCAPCTEWDQSVVTCVRVKETCSDDDNTIDTRRENKGAYCLRSGISKMRPHATDKNRYMVEERPGFWTAMPCAPGTIFNQVECGCIHDPDYVRTNAYTKITCMEFDFMVSGTNGVWAQGSGYYLQNGLQGLSAYFNGNGRVEIPYFTNRYNYPEFSISLWFKRSATSSGLQGILTNGDCAQSASIQILSGGDGSVSASISTDGGDAVINPVQATSNTWHHVVLVYNGQRLSMYVDNVLHSSTETVSGLIKQRYCPLLLGTGGRYMGFYGYIDKVCFFSSALTVADVLNIYQEVVTGA